ncbi:MAG: TonB-dependent receptor [Pseudomonadota bacterium]
MNYAHSLKHAMRTRCPILVALLMLTHATLSSAEPPSQVTFEFDIPAQPLVDALAAFSRVTRQQVAANGAAVMHVESRPVAGVLTGTQALQQMTEDSGLKLLKVNGNDFVLRADPSFAAPDAGGRDTAAMGQSEELIEELVIREDRVSAYGAAAASSATLFSLPIDETPFNIGIITEALIDELQLDTLEDAILTNASVNRTHLHSANAPGVFIRGFSLDPDRLGYLVNGLPVTSGDTAPAHTSALARIEILKGTSALYYGAGEPAGVVNYVYKEPSETARYSMQTTVGRHDEYRAEFDATGSLGSDRLLYRFTLGWEDSKGIVDYDYSKDLAPTLQLLWKPGEQTSVRLIAEYVEHEGNPLVSNTVYLDGDYLIGPKDQYLGLSTDYEESDSKGIQLHLDHKFSDSLQIRLQAGYKDGGRETGNSGYLAFLPLTIPGIVDPDSGLAIRSAFDQSRSAESEYLGAHLAWDKEVLGTSHQFVVGVNYSTSEVTNIGYFNSITNLLPALFSGDFAALLTLPPSVNIFAPEAQPYAHLTNFSETPPFYRDTFEYDNLGLNLQDAIDIPALNLHVLLGLRYARSGFDDLVSLDEQGNSSFIPVGDEDQSKWVPRVGFVYDLTDEHSLFFSYGESFKPPFSSSRDINGNFISEPETGKQFELGWRGQLFDGRLSGTVAAFELTKENIIVDSGVPNVSSLAGEQRSRGIELDVNGQVIDGWEMYLSYAYTDTEVIDAGSSAQNEGERLPGVPDHKLVWWNNFSLDWTGITGLRFGYGIEYVSESLAATVDFSTLSFGSALVPAQGTVHNANLSYARSTDFGDLTVNLGFKNLTDRKYVLNTSNVIGAKRGQPRTVLLTAGVAF